MYPTNCSNCGAPLHNGKCEYCGTEVFSVEKLLQINEEKLEELKLQEAYYELQKIRNYRIHYNYHYKYKDGQFIYEKDNSKIQELEREIENLKRMKEEREKI